MKWRYKISFVVLLVVILSFLFFGGKTSISTTSSLSFLYEGKNIDLKEDEQNEICEIINKHKAYWTLGEESCGFSKDCSIVVGGDTYFCIAGDDCPTFRMNETNKYIDIPETEMNRVKDILTRYGAHFPCC